jgi:hypothetical protein
MPDKNSPNFGSPVSRANSKDFPLGENNAPISLPLRVADVLVAPAQVRAMTLATRRLYRETVNFESIRCRVS